MKLTLKAPAKINLFLEIAGKYPDGYHLLETIMQTVSLYDEIAFTRTIPERTSYGKTTSPQDISLSIISGIDGGKEFYSLPSDDSNIIIRAAKTLKEKYGINQGAKITLKKNIPLGAGLG